VVHIVTTGLKRATFLTVMTIQVWSFMLCHLWSCRWIPAIQSNMPLPSSGLKSTLMLYMRQRVSSNRSDSPKVLYEGTIQETAL
jgi:hypothetical protein